MKKLIYLIFFILVSGCLETPKGRLPTVNQAEIDMEADNSLRNAFPNEDARKAQKRRLSAEALLRLLARQRIDDDWTANSDSHFSLKFRCLSQDSSDVYNIFYHRFQKLCALFLHEFLSFI